MVLYNYSKIEIMKEARTMQTIVITVETNNCIDCLFRIRTDINVI